MFGEFDDRCLNLFCDIYNAIIFKEADTRLDVFVYVVDVQQEEYRSQN